MKLTQRVVDGVRSGVRAFVWDDNLKGFGLRVSEGSVSYIVDFRLGATRRRVALGSTGLLTLVEARERAQDILISARRGQDLTVEPRRNMPTYMMVWRQMIDEVDKQKLSSATIEDYEDRNSRLILPRIGHKLVCDVTPTDLDKIVSATPGDRNRNYVVALVRKTFNFAKRARILPVDHHSPASDIVIKKLRKTGRAVDEQDIVAFGKALTAMEVEGKISPWLSNLYRLSLICGLRPGEVRTLTWEAIDIARRKMTVIGKSGMREIFLTDSAIRILEATPKVQGCDYVFAGRRFGKPLTAIHKGLRAVQKRAGIKYFRPYDFRHTAATGALASGADVRAVQALLGHADLRTTTTYLHVDDKRQQDAAEGAEKFGKAVLRTLNDE